MGSPLDLLDKFVPSEQDLKTLRKWRLLVGIVCLSVILGSSTSPYWAPKILETKAAAQEVHQQIKEELNSVGESVKHLSSVLEEAEKARAQREAERDAREREATVRLIRQQIYETQRDACAASGEVRRLLLQQVDGLKSEFMALTGTEYPHLDCSGF